MFFDNQSTPFDVRFRLGPFPVKVNPFFWLSMAIVGAPYFDAGFDLGLIWIACGFVSILWHELGHTVAMRYYGSPARIELFAFGGVAIPSYVATSPWRRMMIAAAGPLAGFGLLGLVWGSNKAFGWGEVGNHKYLVALYLMLTAINLFWNLLNLLPIWPLDGSKIFREVLVVRNARQPDYVTMKVSLYTAVFLGVVGVIVNFGPADLKRTIFEQWPWWLAWAIPGPMMTLFVFLMAYQSYLLMQQFNRPRLYVEDDDRLPWERR
jgi:Zn-dependent protease